MKKIPKKIAIAMGLFLYSMFALAQSSGGGLTYEPVPNDIVLQFLGVLFGDLGPIKGGGGGVFTGPIALFNGIILTFGGIILSYMWVVASMRTAHSGTVLGDASAQVGNPIKTSVGAALVAPIFNGYSVINMITATLIASGIGAGDKMWSAYTSTMTDSMQQLSLQSINTPARSYGYEMFKVHVCMAAGDKLDQNLADKIIPDFFGRYKTMISNGWESMTGGKQSKQFIRNFSNSESFSTLYNSGAYRCGTETFHKLQDISFPNSTGKFTNPSNLASKGITFSSFNAYALNAQKTLNQSLQKIAVRVVNGDKVDGKEVDAAIDTYIKTYRDEVLGNIKKSGVVDQVAKSAADGGFASIATYYTTFTTLQTAISKALQNVPSASSYPGWLRSYDGEGAASKEAEVIMLNVEDTLAGTKGAVGISAWKNTYAANLETVKDSKKEGISLMEAWDQSDMNISRMLQIYARDNLYSDQGFDSSVNGISQAKAMGDKIFTFIGGFTAGALIAQVISSIAAGPAVALHTASVLLYSIALPPAFFLSYAVPMLPYLMLTGIIFNYIILAIEGILLSQLWGLSFMMPGGDSILGTSHQGTKMVLNLVLRPMLIVLGFIASIAILSLASQWLAATFNDVFSSMMTGADWFSQIVGIVANWTLYGAALFLIIQKSVGLCATLPDKCLQWLTGDASTSAQNEGAKFGGMAAAGAGAAIGSQTAGAIGKAGDAAMTGTKSLLNQIDKTKGYNKDNEALSEIVGGSAANEGGKNGGSEEGEAQSFSEVSARNRNQDSEGGGHNLDKEVPTEQPVFSQNADTGKSGISTNQFKDIATKIGEATGQDTSHLSDRQSYKDFISQNRNVSIESSDGSYKPVSEVLSDIKHGNEVQQETQNQEVSLEIDLNQNTIGNSIQEMTNFENPENKDSL